MALLHLSVPLWAVFVLVCAGFVTGALAYRNNPKTVAEVDELAAKLKGRITAARR